MLYSYRYFTMPTWLIGEAVIFLLFLDFRGK